MNEYIWRPMQDTDLDGVVTVAATAFPDHFEGRECFAERLALYPQGCFALASGDDVKGYLITYPWPLGAIPPLNTQLGQLPSQRDAIYLHDLALHPDQRGKGHVRPILSLFIEQACDSGASTVALVSVNESNAFWQSMGFTPMAVNDALRHKLASYGDDSIYMTRTL